MVETKRTDSQWLRLGEASQLLGVHPTTLRAWVDAGAISSFRTPGGHRRFDASDLQTFLHQRRTTPPGRELAIAERNPLDGIRQQFGESRIERQRWYRQLSEEQRAKDRETGRRMLGLLIQYASRRENAEHFLEQGRAVARSYGHDLAQIGMSIADVARAFLFIRRAILNATHQPQDTTAPNDAEGLRLYQRINGFMDEILLVTLEAYEATKARGNPRRPLARKSVKPKRRK